MKRSGWLILLALVIAIAGCGGGGKSGGDKMAPAGDAAKTTGGGNAAGKIEIKVDMIVTADSSWYPAAQRFKEQVEQRTNGKVTVSLHPGGELVKGNQANEIPFLQSGEIDMTIVSDTIMAGADPKIGAVSLPWLFRNYGDVDKFRSSPVAQELLDGLKSHGMIGLAWGEGGFRQLTNAKHPVAKPEDLKDLHIRVPNVKLLVSTWKAMGYEPTIVNFLELPAKIKAGEVDGQENAIDVIMSAKLYEIQNQISLWNYSYDGLVFAISQKTWDKLDSASQDIVRKTAQEVSNYQVQLSRGVAMSQIKFLKDKGMTVTELTPEQIEAFRSKVGSVYTEYEASMGKDLISKLRALSQ